MSVVWQRILLAAFLSLSGCFVTYSITTRSRIETPNFRDEQPVAVLVASENDVHRRASGRLVWRQALQRQHLFAGEAIRTEIDSTATLQFLFENVIVQLDPETVIEIEKVNDGINLDFLKGNLFIQSDSPDSELTLSSSGRKIVVQNAEISLAKTSANAPLQIEVNKGAIRDSHKVKEPQRIEVITPAARQVAYFEPEQKNYLRVQWKPLDPSYQISFETGTSPQRLNKVANQNVTINGLAANVELPTGKHYLRVTATDPSGRLPTLYSFTRRVDLRAKLPPIALQPTADAEVKVAQLKPKVEFRWANPGQLQGMVLEYARSRDLRVDNSIVRVKNELSSVVDLRWGSGDVYWRISGTIPGTREALASKIQKFTLVDSHAVPAQPVPARVVASTPTPQPTISPTPQPTPPPTPTRSPSPTPAPKRQAAAIEKPNLAPPSVSDMMAQEGVKGKTDGSAELSWSSVPHAKQYQVQVFDSQKQVVQTVQVSETSIELTNLKTGEYNIVLSSIDQAGQVGMPSKEVPLHIPEYSSVPAPKIKSLNIK